MEKKVAFLGKTITFTTFPDEVYYYLVYSSEYRLAFAPTLIKIERNGSLDKEYASWEAYLEKDGACFSDDFKIRVDLFHVPLPDPVSMVLHVKNPMDQFSYKENTFTFTTDEEGYLTLDGHMAELSVYDNCILQLELEDGNGKKYYDVEIEDGIGRCTIMP